MSELFYAFFSEECARDSSTTLLFSQLRLLRFSLAISAPIRRMLKARKLYAVDVILRQRLMDRGYFVVVGANDGRRGDMLWKFLNDHEGWRGILIEPMWPSFLHLKSNFSNEARFVCVNIAISDHCGTEPIYFLDDKCAKLLKLPWWWDQIASFDHRHLTRHFGSEILPYVRSAVIPCDTLESVIRKHWSGDVDLIVIDAEGTDFRILSSQEFVQFRPHVIIFEHKHMTASERTECASMLARLDYSIFKAGGDTIAWRRDPHPSPRSRPRSRTIRRPGP